MGKIIAKIVLTGGPCAGKTTALSKIAEYYQEQGYKVLIVNESATEIIKGGIKPFGKSPYELLKFQDLILKYQMFKENLYVETAHQYPDDEQIIIVHDRGLLDNKAYVGQKKFTELLRKNNINEIDIMDKYDMIIHLVTAADGAEDAYTLSNNTARTETIEQAKELDKKTIDAWAGHQNLQIIGNETNFEEKMNKVIERINSLINAPISLRFQKKYLVNLNNSDLSSLNSNNSTLIKLNQYYLKNDDVETRLRVRDYDGSKTYYITVQKKLGNGKSNVITNRSIDEKVFEDFLLTGEYTEIEKRRYSFIINKQYYELDIFKDSEYALLEVKPTTDNMHITIPSWLDVTKEVTGNFEYSNSELSRKRNKVLMKTK